jgi:hypothetical protein
MSRLHTTHLVLGDKESNSKKIQSAEVRSYVSTYVVVYTNLRTGVYMYIHIYTYIYICIYIYIYIYMREHFLYVHVYAFMYCIHQVHAHTCTNAHTRQPCIYPCTHIPLCITSAQHILRDYTHVRDCCDMQVCKCECGHHMQG